MIIAFGHRKLVGKDTVCKFLTTYIRLNTSVPMQIKKVGFADEVKHQTHRLYGWAGLQDADYYERNPEQKSAIIQALGKSARDVWIEYGTKVARVIYPDTWVDYLFKSVTSADFYLIKDLRFVNEFDKVHSLGGLCVKVVNQRIPNTEDLADSPLSSEDIKWDYIIFNNGSFDELNNNVRVFAEKFELLKKKKGIKD